MSTLPAAAVPKGAVVLRESCPPAEPSEGEPVTGEATILRVHNGTPVIGLITWETDLGDVVVGGGSMVEVVSLP